MDQLEGQLLGHSPLEWDSSSAVSVTAVTPEETEMKLGIPDKLVHEPSREGTAGFNQILPCKRSDVSMFG